MIIFGLGYPWRFDWVGGAFLRQDWLAAVGVAVCLLKRKHFGLAGGLIAYATMVRVFPGGFLVGPTVVFLRHLVERPVHRRGSAVSRSASSPESCSVSPPAA